jgi:hypothetical protein
MFLWSFRRIPLLFKTLALVAGYRSPALSNLDGKEDGFNGLSSFVRKRCLIISSFQFQERIKPAFRLSCQQKKEAAAGKSGEVKGERKGTSCFSSPFPLFHLVSSHFT